MHNTQVTGISRNQLLRPPRLLPLSRDPKDPPTLQHPTQILLPDHPTELHYGWFVTGIFEPESIEAIEAIICISDLTDLTRMTDPEAAKTNNWQLLTASLAAFFAAIAVWLNRRAGQATRPMFPPQSIDMATLKPLMDKVEESSAALRNELVGRIDRLEEKVERTDSHVRVVSLRVARMEGSKEGEGD